MRITVASISDHIIRDFDAPAHLYFSPSRRKIVSHPRQVAMYLARELTPLSYPSLARIFRVDHTTVLHGVRAVKKRISTDRSLGLKIEARKLLLQCETQKTVETKCLGFFREIADEPHVCPQSIHSHATFDRLADDAAMAA
jgi:hypothetical protein